MFIRPTIHFWIVRKRVPLMITIVSIILFLIISTFIFIEKRLESTIVTIADARAKQVAVNCINKIIKEKIINNEEYEDIIKIHKDDRGRIVLMQPDIIKIDKLQSETSLEVNKALSNLSNEEINIPLGQILGSQLLASYGPNINLSVIPIGTVDVYPINQFKAAGINQTRQMLSLRIESQVKVVVPMVKSNINVKTEILIADNIILGDVPKEYTNINLDNFLDKNLNPIN